MIPSEHLSFLIPCLWDHIKKYHTHTPLLPSKLGGMDPAYPDGYLVHRQHRQHQDTASKVNLRDQSRHQYSEVEV